MSVLNYCIDLSWKAFWLVYMMNLLLGRSSLGVVCGSVFVDYNYVDFAFMVSEVLLKSFYCRIFALFYGILTDSEPLRAIILKRSLIWIRCSFGPKVWLWLVKKLAVFVNKSFLVEVWLKLRAVMNGCFFF